MDEQLDRDRQACCIRHGERYYILEEEFYVSIELYLFCLIPDISSIRRAWWSQYRDELIKRDIGWIRSLNPNGPTLESWMRDNHYNGDFMSVLKRQEHPDELKLNTEVTSKL